MDAVWPALVTLSVPLYVPGVVATPAMPVG